MAMLEEKDTDEKTSVVQKLLKLFVFGFFLVSVGMLILIAATILSGESSISFGGILFIWFIPIAFGVGQNALIMILVAIILAILSVLLLTILQRIKLAKNWKILCGFFFFAIKCI